MQSFENNREDRKGDTTGYRPREMRAVLFSAPFPTPVLFRLFFRLLASFDALDLLLEIALEAAILVETKRRVLLLGKPFGNLGRHGAALVGTS